MGRSSRFVWGLVFDGARRIVIDAPPLAHPRITPMRARRLRLRRTSLVLVDAFAALGCFSCRSLVLFTPTAPQAHATAPVPDSPQNAVKLLQWSWMQRDTAAPRLAYPG